MKLTSCHAVQIYTTKQNCGLKFSNRSVTVIRRERTNCESYFKILISVGTVMAGR
jgi:hypothetical protein